MARRLRPLSRTALTGALTLLLLGVPVGAGAESWSGPDRPRADAVGSTYDPEPAPCGTVTTVDSPDAAGYDLTRIAVRHTRTQVRLRASYDDLSSSGSLFTQFHLRTDGRDFLLDVDRWRTGARAEPFLALEPEWPDPEEIGECGSVVIVTFGRPCPGLVARIRPGLDLVEATVPRSCLGTPRWVRLAAGTSGVRKGVTYDDRWVPPGRTEGWILGPFGPRRKAGSAPSDVPLRGAGAVGGRRELVVTASGALPEGERRPIGPPGTVPRPVRPQGGTSSGS